MDSVELTSKAVDLLRLANESTSNHSAGTNLVAMVEHRVLAREVVMTGRAWPAPQEVLLS